MIFTDWGLIDYREALERQLELVSQVREGEEDTVIFCSHPPVVTLGRSSKSEDLVGWSGEVVECSRGGRATYHGPNQLVIYPILNLARVGRKKPRDVGVYLRSLEAALIEALRSLGMSSASNQPQAEHTLSPQGEHWTGIWLGNRKVASIGVAIKHWVTYHGAALNLASDPQGFSGIRPCGFSASVMTSLEEELGVKVDRGEVIAALQLALGR